MNLEILPIVSRGWMEDLQASDTLQVDLGLLHKVYVRW